jgi:seryl-tRNA synthetase
MPQIEEQIKRLQDKLQQLVQQHQLLQRENSKLKQEILEEKNHHNTKSAQAEQLRQQVEILKSSKGEMNTEEKKTLERRLNQYVKEIDRCITLLNE